MTNSVFLTNKNARSCQLYYTKMQHFMLIVRLQRMYASVRQFQPRPAPPPPLPPTPFQAITGHFPALQPRGWGISKFCAARGSEFANHEAPTEIFGTHVVSNANITTQRILLGKQADWIICQGARGQRIKEDCKGMFSFLCMYSFIAYQARIT